MNNTDRFVSLVNDTTFKYLWKNKGTRPFLEKIILAYTGMDAKDFELVDNELNSGNKLKDFRLDIVLKKDNIIINIEMNNEYSDYTFRRNRTYLCKLASNFYLQGEDYTERKNVIQVNFNNYYSRYDKDVSYMLFRPTDIEHKVVDEELEMHEIYLAKFKGLCYNKSKLIDSYLSMFAAKSTEEMKKSAGNDKEAMKIMDELERLKLDEKFIGLYDAAKEQKMLENSARIEGIAEGKKLGLAEGKELGLAEGQNIKAMEIAKSMLKENIDIDTISKCTDLSLEQINNL